MFLGFLSAVWQSGTAVFDSARATGPWVGGPRQPRDEPELPDHATQYPREVRSKLMAQEDEAVKSGTFEKFQQQSAAFWMEQYEAELAAAERRIAEETRQALAVARERNAAAMQVAERVARQTNGEHYRKALRVANNQLAAHARTAARIAKEQEVLAGIAARSARERLIVEEAAARALARKAVAHQPVATGEPRTTTPWNRRMNSP